MSTAGSTPEGGPPSGGASATGARPPLGSSYGPPAASGGTEGAPPAKPRATRIVRWHGLIPLALLIVLLVAGYAAFGDAIVRNVAEDAVSDLMGTQVDIGQLEILEGQPGLRLGAVQIADPFDPGRNLLDIAELFISVEPLPLLEKKYIVNRLSFGNVRVGQRRRERATRVATDGLARSTLLAVRDWKSKFDVPLLRLAPIDSVKAIAVDPQRLSAVRAALALRDDADSLQRDVRNRWNSLRVPETIDSARALTTRLSSTNPRTLGIAGVRTAISDVRRTIARIDSTKRRIDALQATARNGVAALDGSVRAIDDSARADYLGLRSLLALPTFSAPDIGGALFGPVTIDQLQKLLFWVAAAEQYTPPGLKPRPSSGPERLRASGTTVRFVERGELPRFWLRRGDIDLRLDDGLAAGRYRLRAADVTSDPEIVGKPMLALLERVGAPGTASIRAAAVIDRVSSRPRDSVAVSISSLPLPAFALPATPFRLNPGAGQSFLSLTRAGNGIAGRWDLRADQIRWLADSASLRGRNQIEQLVYRVITGIDDIELSARVSGTLTEPKLAVRSNLDRAIADRVRAVIGEEAARAEARLRAEVDRIVAERSAPVKARVAELRTEAETKIDEARARLDEERKKLDERLKALTKGAIGLPI